VLSDQDLVRENVANIIRDFIDHERQHMAMEERVVFPAAPCRLGVAACLRFRLPTESSNRKSGPKAGRSRADEYSSRCRLLALLRHTKIADGLPLSVQEQSCSGYHSNG
jgi:hypothetical protein